MRSQIGIVHFGFVAVYGQNPDFGIAPDIEADRAVGSRYVESYEYLEIRGHLS